MNGKLFIIHFTSFKTKYKNYSDRDNEGFNNLLGIIENGFRFNKGKTFTPREPLGKFGISIDVGMICLTEIDLSDLSDNLLKFGNFGICMKRDWVKKYSGQPVLYSFKSSVNNKLFNELNQILSTTGEIFLETGDKRINQVSLSLANIINHFQAITEVIKYKYENEWRIIDDSQNEVLNGALNTKLQIKSNNNCDVYFHELFLPISNGDDAEFFIIPESYEELFHNKVVNPESNTKKIKILEKLLNE